MKAFAKIIFNIIFMLSLIKSKTVFEEVLADNPQVIDLGEEMTQFILMNASQTNSKVLVEIIYNQIKLEDNPIYLIYANTIISSSINLLDNIKKISFNYFYSQCKILIILIYIK